LISGAGASNYEKMRGWRARGKFSLVVAVAVATTAALASAQTAETLYQVRAVPDVPSRLPAPYAVMPFENRSGVSGLDWMSAGVPFVVGEKLEVHRALRPVYGPLVVPRDTRPVPASADSVRAFARKTGARWIVTGWVQRPNWELELAIALWSVDGESAKLVGEIKRRGDFNDVHAFVAEALEQLCDRAGLALDSHARARLREPTTRDFYAFTLFGRGVDALTGTSGAADANAAENSLKRSVFIDPNLAAGWRVLGQYYLEAGKNKQSAARISRALDLQADYYPALVTRAEMYREGRELDRAVELYERALVLRPWDLEPRYRLGSVYWELTRIDDAFRELQRLVRANPDHIPARRLLVMIHAAKGQEADLVRELERLSALDANDLATQMDLAAAYVAVDRPKDAIGVYEAVLAKSPKNVQAMKFLGDLHRSAGDARRAVALYRQAIQIKPTDPRPYFLLGALYVDLGDDRSARSIFQRAQRFTAYQPEVFNNLGAIAYRAGRLGESLWYLKRAVAKKPNRARYRYNYALSLSAAGSADDALAQVDESLKLAPSESEAIYLRGVVLLRLGRVDEAEKEFRKVLAAEPSHENARHNLEMIEQLARRAREGEVVIEGR